mmetsp:Transcript_14091/g.31182  ORF Transcript_14091/g.31182 Transcript_14091/m.31182 type:complete len:529 (-) Transcript_14091:270-1856(-)|eukprot:CAMPEP_0206488660 /NCGR_PEP_ID=MMETSP0324_2-20121206/42589_1 /ASSEMBLY_ACC=CAM_ASM_000836 /TAXON_ID=2866 /ORGANISM="Crypthecodinium cohnii, Strain Seligo" /LENGTH=528 /DNA_ID=CAMNT_0053967815 /DNA_START=268 /DNA_END=1854 /DNA_ORIENTATION=+
MAAPRGVVLRLLLALAVGCSAFQLPRFEEEAPQAADQSNDLLDSNAPQQRQEEEASLSLLGEAVEAQKIEVERHAEAAASSDSSTTSASTSASTSSQSEAGTGAEAEALEAILNSSSNSNLSFSNDSIYDSPMPSLRSPSIAVFTRVTEADMPYVTSFFQHWARIGVTKFYLMNSKFEEHHKELMEYIQAIEMPPSNVFEFLSLDNIVHTDPISTPGLMDYFTEDFLVNVDVDEYWVLPSDVKTIHDLLEGHPADIYYMRWAMLISDSLDPEWSNPYRGHWGFPGKWMARRDMLKTQVEKGRFFGHHIPPVKTTSNPQVLGDYTYGLAWDPFESLGLNMFKGKSMFGRELPAYDDYNPGLIAHFWCRSFYDMVLKTQRYNKGETCTATLSATVANLTDTAVPDRVGALAFLMISDREPVVVDAGHDLLFIDKDLEKKLALEATCEDSDEAALQSIESFHDSYLAFEERLNKEMLAGNYPEHWPQTGLTMDTHTNFNMTVMDWLHHLYDNENDTATSTLTVDTSTLDGD